MVVMVEIVMEQMVLVVEVLVDILEMVVMVLMEIIHNQYLVEMDLVVLVVEDQMDIGRDLLDMVEMVVEQG